jgi:transposase
MRVERGPYVYTLPTRRSPRETRRVGKCIFLQSYTGDELGPAPSLWPPAMPNLQGTPARAHGTIRNIDRVR